MNGYCIPRLVRPAAVVGLCWLFASAPVVARAADSASDEAAIILQASGVKGGLVVQLGCGDGKLTAALAAGEQYLVHALEDDAERAAEARRQIRSQGLYGRASVEQFAGDRLPYADSLVNLLVSEEALSVSQSEVMRVLAPGGVLIQKIQKGTGPISRNGPEGASQKLDLSPFLSGGWTKTRKPWPNDIDEWTHYLHDASGNAVANDRRVGPPRHLQWLAGPAHCRSHEHDSSVSALVSSGGRIFYILDEGLTGIIDQRLPAQWSLVARDAFSGVLLWKRPLPNWGWREWKEDQLRDKDWSRVGAGRLASPAVLPRRLVAFGDRLYVTLGFRAPLSELDAATGEEIRTFPASQGTDEILYDCMRLILCLREIPATGAERGLGKAPRESIVALRIDTGEVLWRHDAERILPLSLAAERGRVYFHTYDHLIAVDQSTGRELWRVEDAADRGGVRGQWSVTNTLVAHDDVVMMLGTQQLRAFSADSGDLLWSTKSVRGCSTPPDLFVASGLVWHGGPTEDFNMRDPRNVLINGLEETLVVKKGRDLKTGEVKQTVTVENLIDMGHHFRCHRSKATERYLLWPKRGVEFIDLEGSNHDRCDWLRAPCRLGMMPADGLLYVPPNQCFCYPGVLLDGFNALAAASRDGERKDGEIGRGGDRESEAVRLERGPAYNPTAFSLQPTASSPSDWPTLRHDASRSGATTVAVANDLEVAWQADVGPRLSAPVAAGGRVLVSSIDTHTVHCLDADGGGRLWSFTAGGPVDSPPTVSGPVVLFGSTDGWVYCLTAADGTLVWRFRAAPSPRKVVVHGRVTSAWPVHGSVLVRDGVVYFSAGRSSYLDGGIFVYGLEVATGRKLYETCIEGPHPNLPNDPGWAFDCEGARSEVLVAQDDLIYMRQVQLSLDLGQQPTPRITRLGDRKIGLHLFSTSSLLDDSWYNRTFWMYSSRWPGYYRAHKAPKTGQLLVFDAETTYGVKVYDSETTGRPWFVPGTGYQLFADSNDNEPFLDEKAANWDKGPGFQRAEPAKWSRRVPVRVRGLVLAGDRIFAAGPPDVLDAHDPLAAFEGRSGALLQAVSAEDGRQLSEYPLDSPPVLDGLIAAGGKLYIATHDGRLTCMGGKH